MLRLVSHLCRILRTFFDNYNSFSLYASFTTRHSRVVCMIHSHHVFDHNFIPVACLMYNPSFQSRIGSSFAPRFRPQLHSCRVSHLRSINLRSYSWFIRTMISTTTHSCCVSHLRSIIPRSCPWFIPTTFCSSIIFINFFTSNRQCPVCRCSKSFLSFNYLCFLTGVLVDVMRYWNLSKRWTTEDGSNGSSL